MTAAHPHTPAGTPRFRIGSEVDVLALVPFSMGFLPEDSVVLVALGPGGRPFLARVDLPEGDDPGSLDPLADAVVEPASRHGAVQALVVVYTADAALGAGCAAAVAAACRAAGLEVPLALRTDGRRWWRTGPGGPEGPGTPYDLRSHPLTAQGVVEGRVTYRSREELAASLLPGARSRVEEVRAAHAALGPLPRRRPERRHEVRRVAAELRAHAPDRPLPADAVARALRAAADPELRDGLWVTLTPGLADSAVAAWREVVRSSPSELVAPAAAVLALSAWLAGHGALAWCAVERSLEAQPDQSLARLVGDLLDRAVPPSAWPRLRPESLELFDA